VAPSVTINYVNIANSKFLVLLAKIKKVLICINKFIDLKKVDTKYILNFSNDVFCFVVRPVA
jgi:hypothetical protein